MSDGEFPQPAKVRSWPNPPDMVSPPTRGWSPYPCGVHAGAGGVPAYAGMVLNRIGSNCNRPWCPRLRGDGPLYTTLQPWGRMVSPPTRGWSSGYGSGVAPWRGVPAYAGMVPAPSPGRRAADRCPRLRGDGPTSRITAKKPQWVSPPTRGWSRSRRLHALPRNGVPAYAGMVRVRLCLSIGVSRCPRLRGDGPGYLQKQER